MTLPATLGCDGSGVIAEVGDGVDPARIGEQVLLYPGLDWGEDPALPRADFGLLGMPGPGTIAESIIVRKRPRRASPRASGRRHRSCSCPWQASPPGAAWSPRAASSVVTACF